MDNQPIFKKVAFGGFDKQSVLDYVFQLDNNMKELSESLTAQLSEVGDARDTLSRSLREAESKLQCAQSERENLSAELRSEKGRVGELSELVDTMRAELKRYESQSAQREEEVAGYMRLNGELTRKNELLESKTKEVEEAAAQIGQAMKRAKAEADAMLENARQKSETMEREACERAERVTTGADERAESITAEATAKAETMTAETESKVQTTLAEAQRKAERLMADAKACRDNVCTEINAVREELAQADETLKLAAQTARELMRKAGDAIDKAAGILSPENDDARDGEREAQEEKDEAAAQKPLSEYFTRAIDFFRSGGEE